MVHSAAVADAASANNNNDTASHRKPGMKRVASRPMLYRKLKLMEGRLGTTAYVDEMGAGSDAPTVPLLLLHGFTTNTYTTLPLALEVLERANTGNGSASAPRVITLDFFGWGMSELHRADDVQLTEDVFCEQVFELLQHLRLDRVTIVGNSMGAVVGAALACRRPELVHKLCLVGPGGIPISGRSLLSSPSLMAARLLFHLGTNPLIGDTVVDLCGLTIKHVLPFCADMLGCREPVDEWLHQLDTNPNFCKYVHGALNNFDFYSDKSPMWRQLEQTRVDVLLCWGANDRISPPGSLRHLLPSAKTVIIPDLAHSPQYEDPAATYDALHSFFLQ